jgi:hypothetical protein
MERAVDLAGSGCLHFRHGADTAPGPGEVAPFRWIRISCVWRPLCRRTGAPAGLQRMLRILSAVRSAPAFMSTANPTKTTAFMKALKPSAALAVIVGPEALPRTEVTKRIWDYIKAHNLQNPANKRNILCDGPLRAVMGKDEVTMFEMTSLVGKHLGPN